MLDLTSLSLVKTLWCRPFINDECTSIDTLSEIEPKLNKYTCHIYMAETESDQWSCNATSEIHILLTLFKPKTVKFSASVELSLISDLHGSMGVAVKSCRGIL